MNYIQYYHFDIKYFTARILYIFCFFMSISCTSQPEYIIRKKERPAGHQRPTEALLDKYQEQLVAGGLHRREARRLLESFMHINNQ
ncbi:MAG: hypothetical protein HRT88_15640, partial [Lentisphaeraceae bacterium]|nr:hypothetical protein [Lentisphaeraceae bacterium]